MERKPLTDKEVVNALYSAGECLAGIFYQSVSHFNDVNQNPENRTFVAFRGGEALHFTAHRMGIKWNKLMFGWPFMHEQVRDDIIGDGESIGPKLNGLLNTYYRGLGIEEDRDDWTLVDMGLAGSFIKRKEDIGAPPPQALFMCGDERFRRIAGRKSSNAEYFFNEERLCSMSPRFSAEGVVLNFQDEMNELMYFNMFDHIPKMHGYMHPESIEFDSERRVVSYGAVNTNELERSSHKSFYAGMATGLRAILESPDKNNPDKWSEYNLGFIENHYFLMKIFRELHSRADRERENVLNANFRIYAPHFEDDFSIRDYVGIVKACGDASMDIYS